MESSPASDANSTALNQYVAGQLVRHPLTDERVTARLARCQFHDPAVTVDEERIGNYGRFVFAIHVVVENSGGWYEIRDEILAASRNMIDRMCRFKRWRLARIGMLCNHIHLLLGCNVTESPEDVALSILNNLSYAQGMIGDDPCVQIQLLCWDIWQV